VRRTPWAPEKHRAPRGGSASVLESWTSEAHPRLTRTASSFLHSLSHRCDLFPGRSPRARCSGSRSSVPLSSRWTLPAACAPHTRAGCSLRAGSPAHSEVPAALGTVPLFRSPVLPETAVRDRAAGDAGFGPTGPAPGQIRRFICMN
jgi:hypothetical protein